eukprot:scaffold994_cov226-Prasinococcus_capsulatus_cf.AAC.17
MALKALSDRWHPYERRTPSNLSSLRVSYPCQHLLLPVLACQGLHARCCDRGVLSYLSSQNVDGLHLRSGIARHLLAELHGNCFAERCASCGFEYVRDFELRSVGFRPTPRRCTIAACRGRLHDQCLDWVGLYLMRCQAVATVKQCR